MSAIASLAPAPSQIAVPSLLSIFAGGPPLRVDIENSTYHADRSCVSVSGLKQILRSPAHFRAYLDGQRVETPAMFLGTAIHARLLEPADFDRLYVVAPVTDKRSKEYREFELLHANKRILTPEQLTTILGIEHSVSTHPAAMSLLRTGIKESTLVWRDEATGIWLKIRPDCLCPDVLDGICLDVKSTEDATPAAFSRSCVDWGYDLQAAVYLEGLRVIFGRDFDFGLLPVEKKEPYGRALYTAPPEMIERGRRQMREALSTLRDCLEHDKWPGYQSDGDWEELSWPRWAV